MKHHGQPVSVLAVVLNWNESEMTVRSVQSLLDQQSNAPHILVVDNHSDQDPTNSFQSRFPSIRIHRNDSNLGVAGGRNVGIRVGLREGYKFILLFDNDAVASPTMVVRLTEAAGCYPEAGVFGPKIRSAQRPQVIWRAGCTSWRWSYLHAGSEIVKHLARFANRPPPIALDTLRGEGREDLGQYDQPREVAFQIGCAQLIRREVFERVGLLDEEFSPYGGEDIDFCGRASDAGFRIRYVPKAVCWHREGGSFRDSYQRSYHNAKNALLLARKHLNPITFWFTFYPDYLFFTVPLMLLHCTMTQELERRRGYLEAIRWTIKDISKRGVLLKQIDCRSNPDSGGHGQ